jgi:hypothetical protein
MRKFFLTAFVLAATLCLAGSSFALEKTSAKLGDDSRPDGWTAASSCYIIYSNTCTGWVWVWSGWGPNDVLGACVQSCCQAPDLQTTLDVSWHFVRTGSPAGYGFTGSADVRAADAACCPTGPALASQVFLPATGWNQYLWGTQVPSSFVVSLTTGPGTLTNPLALDTDHPAAGPTGPASCGFCFPTNRVSHSFYYGTVSSPLCPGSTLNDGICDAEWRWEFGLSCDTDIAVEESSWGTIKNLYR